MLRTVTAISTVSPDQISMAEILELTGIPESFLRELIDLGWINPQKRGPRAVFFFSQSDVYRLRKMNRLRLSFDLDSMAVSLIMDLLDRIDHMETRLLNLERMLNKDE